MNVVLCRWPECPDLPAPGTVALIRVEVDGGRSRARQQVRHALRQVLARWSGVSPESVLLSETGQGVEFEKPVAGRRIGISISYVGTAAWIGLRSGGRLGIDAMAVQAFPELEAVARTFFEPGQAFGVLTARNVAEVFAEAWTALEARCKCLKLGLQEWSAERDRQLERLPVALAEGTNGIVVSLALE